jgi:hypothetical protein
MFLRTLFVTLAVAVAAGLSIAPAHARAVTPCEVYTCMAGISGAGATGGPGCGPSIAYWHTALAVYSPYFNPPASALRRRTYLMTCPGAHVATNAALLGTIISTWGYVP